MDNKYDVINGCIFIRIYCIMVTENEIIDLMEIYLDEWKHRDSMFWDQTFKFYFATLVIIVLPQLSWFDSPKFMPQEMLNAVGFVMSCVFLFVSFMYGSRLRASSKTYHRMIELLGDDRVKRVSVIELSRYKIVGKIMSVEIAYVMPVLLFISLLFVNLTFLLFR